MATFSSDIIISSTFSTTALKVTGGAQNGYVLTSDASGNATWAASSGGSTPSLAQVLAIGNTTSTSNILVSNDTYIAWYSGNTFSSRIIPDTLTANRTLTMPNSTGTIALTSQITNFASNNLTFTGNRIHNTNGFYLDINTDNSAYNQSWFYMTTTDAWLAWGNNYLKADTNGLHFFTGGGTERLRLTTGESIFNYAGSNSSFRFRSDNDENLLYVGGTGTYQDKIGVGTASPVYKLHVVGTVSTTGFRMTDGAQNGYVLTSDASGNATWQASSGGVSGTGTASYVTKWSSSTGLTNSIIYDSGTAIGLGTASPSELLHVDGNVRFGGQVYVDLATTLSPSTNSQSIDWNNSNIQTVDFQNAPSGVTFSFSNPKSGGTYTIKIIQGANLTSVTWPTSVKWESGTILLPTQINDAIDMVTMIYDGSSYYASFGKNFA